MNKTDALPLPMNRKLYFSEQVDQKSIHEITKQILEINDDDAFLNDLYNVYGIGKYEAPPIELYIDSYGGQVYQCLGLIGVMETSKTPIHTYVTGCAMSCGFIILISGHRRFAYKHATPLYHQVSKGMWAPMKTIEEEVKEGKRLQKKLEKLTLSKTKITNKKLKSIYTRKIDWFMTPKEALKLGVIDEIIK